jgi:hypothetical protein
MIIYEYDFTLLFLSVTLHYFLDKIRRGAGEGAGEDNNARETGLKKTKKTRFSQKFR